MTKVHFNRHNGYAFEGSIIPKIIDISEEQPSLASASLLEKVDIFGIMPAKLKAQLFWAKAAGIFTVDKGEYVLTEFGKELSEEDTYAEDTDTLLKIHFNLATNEEMCPGIYFTFNHYDGVVSLYDWTKHFIRYYGRKGVYVSPDAAQKEYYNLINNYYKESNCIDPEANRKLLQELRILKKEYGSSDSNVNYYKSAKPEAYINNRTYMPFIERCINMGVDNYHFLNSELRRMYGYDYFGRNSIINALISYDILK